MKKKKLKGQLLINVFLIILCLVVIVPMVLVVSISFSNETDIANYGYSIIPKNFDLTAYKFVFENPDTIVQAYKVTIAYSLLGMALSVILMAMLAYMLSVRELKGRSALSFILYFTMLFNGGMVPTYLLYTQWLHLGDSFWIYIVTGLISPWYVFMMRTSMQGIPKEISESALMDGASEYRIFVQMILPLSKPVLATVALFMFLGKWNDWNTSMLYINKPELMSLQYQLQRILQNITAMQQVEQSGANITLNLSEIPTESARMAMAVVVAGPALVIFPFFQKYFTKGLTVGSVKG